MTALALALSCLFDSSSPGAPLRCLSLFGPLPEARRAGSSGSRYADPICGLLGQSQQAALFRGPAADTVELECEQLVTFGYHHSRSIGSNVREGAIAEPWDGFNAVRLGGRMERVVDKRGTRLEIDKRRKCGTCAIEIASLHTGSWVSKRIVGACCHRLLHSSAHLAFGDEHARGRARK